MTRFWNSACGSIRLGVVGHLALGICLVFFWTTAGGAQGFGPDPFHPYNSDYSQYVWPIAPVNDYGFNSQAIRGLRSANQFQNYMNSLQGQGNANGSTGGAGTPYYRANRAYDRDFGRVYQPNKNADQQFDTFKERSTDLYFQYLRERDQRKRADLFRKYNRARNESDRALAASRSNTRPSTRSSNSEGRAGTSSEKESSRERDLLAVPPPVSTDRPRARSGERVRGRTEGSGSAGLAGSAPSPLGNSAAGNDLGHAPNPTEVLDRALRTERERSRVSPRRRGTGPAPPGPPPPP
jgi:hypothetical protein